MNRNLRELLFDELRQYTDRKDNTGGFIPAVKQLANVAALPGVVDVSGFSIHLTNSMCAQLQIRTVDMVLPSVLSLRST